MESTEIIDYPAAHSMDTYWFAVDADGNVAMFDTGEGGAVPEDALRSYDYDGLDFLFAEIAKESEDLMIRVDTPGESILTQLTTVGSIEQLDLSISEDLVYSIILILESDNLIPQLGVETIEDGYIVRFAGEKSIVYVDRMSLANLQKLIIGSQAIIGKLKYHSADFSLTALCGFFEYEHNNHILTPYDRTHIPQYPLKLTDLPEILQLKLIAAGIDRVKFTESELVQPLEHVPCSAWGNVDYWIDTQGIGHHTENPRYTWDAIEQVWVDADGNESCQAW
jgi:hypothetical protein